MRGRLNSVGRHVFLAFATRFPLSVSEIRPKDPLQYLSENVCYSVQDKILRLRGCFGSTQ